jgi:SAM-dependent methyltransferase
MLEHDEYFAASLNAMFKLLKPGGLLLLTAAGHGREEHGTLNRAPKSSPGTHDYYRNIDVTMLMQGLDLTKFSWYEISYINTDIRFAGIKQISDENKKG